VNPVVLRILLLVTLCVASFVSHAQDLEPRRWAQMPTGLNFMGGGLTYGEGEILFDPVLQIEDASFDTAGIGLTYIRSFSMFGKSARADILVPYQSGRWEGLLEGEYVSTRRRGFGDPRIRLSMLLYGGPAETAAEFASSQKSDTVVGAAIAVTVPWGEYFEERLINLGQNRWIVRPQLGVTHTRGKWTYELTGSMFLYSDNDEFFDGNKLETDPLYALQAHVIYTFRPGLWASASTAWGTGAGAAVNDGVEQSKTTNWLTALAVGLPLSRTQGVKITWVRGRTQEDTGSDSDSLILSWSMMFL
jgi:hypothetical protein